VRGERQKAQRTLAISLAVVLMHGTTCLGDSIIQDDLYPPLFSPRWIRGSPAPADIDVDLKFSALVRAGGMEVTYEVINRTGQRYAVFNHLAPGEAGDADAVSIDFTGTSILLSKQVPPWPEMMPPHYDIPAQSIIDPGEKIMQRFMVPLPAIVNNEVRRVWLRGMSGGKLRYKPTALRKTKRVTLMIGILQMRPGLRVTEFAHAPGIYSVEGADLEAEQIALTKTVVLPDPIELFDYEEQPREASP